MASELYEKIAADPTAYGMAFGHGVAGVGGEVSRVDSIFKTLEQLKKEVQEGKLTISQFSEVADPLTKVARASTDRAVANRGAEAITPYWSQLLNSGFVTDRNGKSEFTLPFSRREYASLPEASLPTQDEVQKGFFDPTTAPMDRYRQNTPQVNPGVGGTTLPSAPETRTDPRGGLHGGNTAGGFDESKILAEAEMAKKLREDTFHQQRDMRQRYMSDLSGVLQKQQDAQLSEETPEMLEELNSRGVLASSGVGNALSQRKKELATNTSLRLAEMGINQDNAAVADLGSIENSYLTGREGALGRRFSLEDFDRQFRAGKELGAEGIPQISQPSGKGSGALQGGLGGAATGAKFGAPGAIAGGILGAIGGGQLGGKK